MPNKKKEVLCKECQKRKATHINEPDPYSEEICDEIILVNLCDECYIEICDEI